MDWKTYVLEMLPLVGGLIAIAITWGLMALAKKLKLHLDKEQVMDWVEKVVDFVEEWAAKKIKEDKATKPTSEEKHKTAVAAIRSKYPSLKDNEIEVMIGAALARSPGAGATGEEAVAPKVTDGEG